MDGIECVCTGIEAPQRSTSSVLNVNCHFIFFSTAPSSPTSVSAISLSSNTILVEWNEPLEPNGIVRYYIITVYESDSSLASNGTQENSTSANRSLTIGRLEPFTNYSVIVQAVTVESGSESEVAVVRTNESGRLGEKLKILSSMCMRGLSMIVVKVQYTMCI